MNAKRLRKIDWLYEKIKLKERNEDYNKWITIGMKTEEEKGKRKRTQIS